MFVGFPGHTDIVEATVQLQGSWCHPMHMHSINARIRMPEDCVPLRKYYPYGRSSSAQRVHELTDYPEEEYTIFVMLLLTEE